MFPSEHYWRNPYVTWTSEIPAEWLLFVFHIRDSRIKAKVPAVVEILSVWRPFQPLASLSGPLADQRGVFWIALDPQFLSPALNLLPRLGYSHAADLVVNVNKPDDTARFQVQPEKNRIKWKNDFYHLLKVYQEDQECFRNQAPDRRTFWLERANGDIQPVLGYRGDGKALSRRGLPVEDARLLVNLVSPDGLEKGETLFLDPFGGIGGVVIEAKKAGYQVLSLDIDPKIRMGLRNLGSCHQVGDASFLPFRNDAFQAIATEPPYSMAALPMVHEALDEFYRILKVNGRLSVLVPFQQVESILNHTNHLGLRLFLASRIDRKGTDVAILAWEKA